MTQSGPAAAPPRWDLPEVSVRLSRTFLLYFERTHGREALERLWESAQLPLSLAHLENSSNYVSLDFLELLLDALIEASGDDSLPEKAGRLVATPESLGFAFWMLRSVGTPLLALRATVEYAHTLNRVGHFTIEHASGTAMTVSYRSERRERTRHLCRGRMAQFAALPTAWHLPPAKVIEDQCQVAGADCCRYRISWHRRPPLGWRRFLAALAAGLAGLILQPRGDSGQLSLAALAAAGFFFGAWLDVRRFAASKDALLDEQTRGLGRSLEELQKRADEIFQTNLELDRRVADRTAELAEALERLKRIDALKSEFFANISHELRTPLTLILVPIEDRLSGQLSVIERELFITIERHARRLLRLIDDLLDLSRIDAGQLRLEVAEIDLTALATTVVRGYGAAAEARGIHLEVDAPLSTRDVWGDLHRLESILSNLVGNALKFTQPGGRVTVAVRELPADLCVSVSDTGPGIVPEELPRVFDRYFQSREGVRRGGVGIGLALAKHLAELHHGRIAVESSPGQGSTFTLVIPRGRAHLRSEAAERPRSGEPSPVSHEHAPLAPPHRRATPAPIETVGLSRPAEVPAPPPVVLIQGRRPRLLVVEDQPDLRALLAKYFSSTCDVFTADDGEPALALAKKERPDLILSDVMMPGMSGSALCAAVKSDPHIQATPVILLTARSGPEAALEGFASGADEFVEKPFHPRVLVARVQAQLRLRALSLQVASNARLAAVGTLAAGVGHELRNPVNAVMNGVRILQRQEVEPDAKRLLEVIVDGAQRIEQISSALLAHASPGDRGGARPVDVKEGLESTLQLLSYRLKGVAVVRHYQCESKVVIPAGELNQVLLNLIDNALNTSASHLWIGAEEDDRSVRVTVGDDGPGIPPEVAAHVFDPFFTTREPGQGTGLGLYLSRQAVQRWGGVLQFSGRPGGGTVFTVELPREQR